MIRIAGCLDGNAYIICNGEEYRVVDHRHPKVGDLYFHKLCNAVRLSNINFYNMAYDIVVKV